MEGEAINEGLADTSELLYNLLFVSYVTLYFVSYIFLLKFDVLFQNVSTESTTEKRLRRTQEADTLDNRFGFVRLSDATF